MAGRQHINLTGAQVTSLNAAITIIMGILIPILVALSKAERESLRKMGEKRTGYVNEIWNALDANPTIIPDSYDMADFTLDRSSGTELTSLYNTLVNLTDLLSDSIMILGNQNMGDADAGLELLKSESKHNATVKTVLDAILAGHKNPRIARPEISVPAGGSVSTDVTKGSRFANHGTTVFTLFKGVLTTGGVTVGPGDSVLIADGWNTIRIENMSGTTAGTYVIS